MALYGAVRLTADADVILELSPENIEKFMSALKDLGYKPKVPVNPMDFADPEKRKEWIEEKGMKVLAFWHPKRPSELLDVFVDNPIPFEEIEKEKIIKRTKGFEVPLPSLKHLVKLKRMANRPEDLRDIEMLEKLHGRIQ